MSKKSFLDEVLFIPFGRYEGDRNAPHPADEVLIGRHRRRAQLLDQLFSTGRRGAFLITGHRGSGKTSFVNYCLDEYRENLYGRFLQRNHGRAWLWDRLGLFSIGFLLLLVGIFGSRLLALLIGAAELVTGGEEEELLIWAGIAVLVVLLAYPFFLAQEAVTAAFPPHSGRKFRIFRLLFLPIAIGLSISMLPVTFYTSGILDLLLLGAVAYLAHAAFSWSFEKEGSESHHAPDSPVESIIPNSSGVGMFAPPLIALGAFAAWIVIRMCARVSQAPPLGVLAAIAVIAGLGITCKSFLVRESNCAALRSGRNEKAVSSSALFGFVFGIALLVPGFVAILFVSNLGEYTEAMLAFAAAIFILFLIYARNKPADRSLRPKFQPRPRRLLAFKAFALAFVGVQLLSPLLYLIIEPATVPADAAERKGWELFFSALWGEPYPTYLEHAQWAFSAAMLFALIGMSEYEWIIRPYSRAREDISLHAGPDYPGLNVSYSQARYEFRAMARGTFFWRIYWVLLPVMVIPVNLGFDQLDQRLVIEAMLVGLREKFRRIFLSWRSPFTATRRLLFYLLLAFISYLIAEEWFYLPPEWRHLPSGDWAGFSCAAFDSSSTSSPSTFSPLWSLACTLGGNWALTTLLLAPVHIESAEPALWLDLRTYHLLTFAGLFLLSALVRRWWNPLAYRELDARMTRVIDGLSSRLREEVRPDRVTSWINALRGWETTSSKEGGPFDPRTVELNFLAILRDLHQPRLQLPLGSTSRISLPLPEVVFVFDELDKAGVVSQLEDEAETSATREPLDQERERSRALHELFADLKSLISSGAARFLFVGGRNLHDEWLADSTARRPLLTNIFSSEIYIPSLLLGQKAPEDDVKHAFPVELFVRRHLFRSEALHMASRLRRIRPGLTLTTEEQHRPRYTQAPFYDPQRDGTQSTPPSWPVPKVFTVTSRGTEARNDQFLAHFYEFLTYRSKGNVKRLRETLSSFIVPADRLPRLDFDAERPSFHAERYSTEHDCDHVMAFYEVDHYRIDMIATIYRSLSDLIAERTKLQDDKMPQAMLYLADFLLKFHRRAFSWSHLERVDELVHIHRAPDLRDALHRILLQWQDLYIHPIRNGMYDFRFTREFSRELEYLSRASDEELAALNFTLDESHFLKAIYRSRISVLGEDAGEDFVTGLAELHKFDEEYEVARHYLRRALRSLDQRFEEKVRKNPFDGSASQSLFAREADGPTLARTRLSYGISRVRIMLQIGMTFEKSDDFERASVAYREARTLAESVVDALSRDRETLGDSYLANLKHLHLLFQPLFAEGWLAEKAAFGVDTGPAIIEAGMWRLRSQLPFIGVNDFLRDNVADHRLAIQHANFALIMAELENKLGDLFFFRGREIVTTEAFQRWTDRDADPKERKGGEGYLMVALYHYDLALHELRRYNYYRIESSEAKFSYPISGDSGSWKPITGSASPDFVLRAAAGSLSDLGDSLIARFSFAGLLHAVSYQLRGKKERGQRSLDQPICGWAAGLLERWLRTEDDSHAATESTDENSQKDPSPLTAILHAVFGPRAVGQDRHTLEQEALRQLSRCFSQWFKTGTYELSSDEFIQRDRKNWSEALRQLFPSIELSTGLSDWLGQPASRPSSVRGGYRPAQQSRHSSSSGAIDLLQAERNNTDSERLCSALALSFVAADLQQEGGHYVAAIEQYLDIAETISSLLWWYRGIEFVKENDDLRVPNDLKTGVERLIVTRSLKPFFEDLSAFAVHALHRADLAHRQADGRAAPLPPLAPIAAASLELISRYYNINTNNAIRWLPFEMNLGEAPVVEIVRALEERLRSNPYPLLGRLRTLKLLVDNSLLCPNQREQDPSLLIELLIQLDDRYASPLHFTPLDSGFSLAIASLSFSDQREQTEFRTRALDRLRRSQQLYTMQRTYYEAISDLFYLYDDFNDRTLHAHHARQMAGVEVATYLIRTLKHNPPT